MSQPQIILPPEPFLPVDTFTQLQGLRLCDAEALFILVDANRAFLRRWLPWVDGTVNTDSSVRFIQSARAQLDSNQSFSAGIWHGGALAGVIGFHRIDWSNHNVELGYWMAEKYQGHGIMTRCVREMTDYAFDQLDLHRVQIRCGEGNHKSQAIPERLGFTREGLLHGAENLNGKYINLYVYGMLRHEWEKRRAK